MQGVTRTANGGLRPAVIPALLFAASASFVVWRTTEVGVLVDLGYVVNIATRISLGDVPYRDFPLAQAPGAFVAQAALIKLFGPFFPVQIAYAAILGGIATALTYRIAHRLLVGAVPVPRFVAAVLALPLVPLGIYAIMPNPFYDSDACLLVLLGIAAVLATRDHASRARWLLVGALLTVPLWWKQNIGGAFLLSMLGILALEALRERVARDWLRWCVIGAAVALATEVAALQLIVGLENYIRWAWTFALAGRGVTFSRLAGFAEPAFLWTGGLLLILVALGTRLPARWRGRLFVAGLALPVAVTAAVPLVFFAVPRLFPSLLAAACILAGVRAVRTGVRADLLLPLVLLATTLGTFESQGLNASSFGIFPLLVLAIATLVRDIASFVPAPRQLATMIAVVIAIALTVGGAGYTIANLSLLYIHVNEPGPATRSTFPSLTGLSAHGPYIGELDAMLFWMRDHVRADEPFVFLPGEDPAYFALDRKPGLPSVYFYDVATPFTPADLARFADATGVRWVIVKDKLQLDQVPPLEPELVARLTTGATLVTRVGPYRVFRR